MNGLLITLGLGLFILIGAAIVFFTKNNRNFIQFSLSFAFAVMIMLIIGDLIPESFEVLSSNFSNFSVISIITISGIVGFLLLLTLDHFVPDHEDDLTTTKDDKKNLKHIGFVSSIALIVHNIVEGMAISLIVSTDLTAGLMACIGIGLHNIPLGMVITSTFYQANKNKKKTLWIMMGISLSTFIGGLLVFLLKPTEIPVLLEGISLSLTIGMLLFIIIMELLPKVIHSKDKKATILGIVSGVALLTLSFLI